MYKTFKKQQIYFMNLIQKILNDLKVELADKFDKNFSSGGFFGKKWKARKDGYETHLNNTGRLRSSIHSRISGTSLTFTSDTPYSAVHNEGLRAGRGKGFIMPKRQFIGEYPGMDKTIERIAKDAVGEQVKLMVNKLKR